MQDARCKKQEIRLARIFTVLILPPFSGILFLVRKQEAGLVYFHGSGILRRFFGKKGRGAMPVGKVHIFDHPLIQHKLTRIRDINTGPKEFRELVEEAAMLMAYEVTRDFPLQEVEIETPLEKMKGKILAGRKVGIIPILRAGLGMVSGILKLIPAAKVGHVGLYRDPDTLKPVEYYCKLPTDVTERDLIVIDPMLATGGSATAAIQFLKEKGGEKIKLMCLLAAPPGIEAVQQAHPEVDIFVAAVDPILNDHGYIVPGLGDAGDRLFGTK
jgi:uracil phosphoribosyltransferase